jgi:hypothetical protein
MTIRLQTCSLPKQLFNGRAAANTWLGRARGTCLLALGLGGCTQELIANTDVEDTHENRAIIEFCETYRKAVERKDIQRLFSLAHEQYYEDSGTLDATDDIDIAGLREYLQTQFVQSNNIRYDIRYRRVSPGSKNHVYVDYTFSASYKVPTDEGELWQRRVSENRLELVPIGEGSYKIIAGM